MPPCFISYDSFKTFADDFCVLVLFHQNIHIYKNVDTIVKVDFVRVITCISV